MSKMWATMHVPKLTFEHDVWHFDGLISHV
jgi:hypothetical protein